MADDKQTAQNTPQDDRLSIDASSPKIDTEAQKYFTDPDPVSLMFYCALSGYRVVYIPHVTETFGHKKIEMEKTYTIDKVSRVSNEDGANFVMSSVMPLISPLMTTSKLSEKQIYNLWNGKIDDIIQSLLMSYYIDKNPYEININRFASITTMLCELYGITSKAKEGFTLTQLAQSFITSTITRTGNDPTATRATGLMAGIQGALGGGKK